MTMPSASGRPSRISSSVPTNETVQKERLPTLGVRLLEDRCDGIGRPNHNDGIPELAAFTVSIAPPT